ncbi:uncharacterized protein LOC131333222 [Rhododendron vialii]|uniref:uncharacterized protein LOC131333222 n=1 Tax=Rhododendron vialii TaxID=182163 RepID=UPI00265E5CF5|nr:uncharacterized protein LOC131333222 [Rhododendron vialii]
MGRSLKTEECLSMLKVVELFQNGSLVYLPVDLGLERKTSIKSILGDTISSSNHLMFREIQQSGGPSRLEEPGVHDEQQGYREWEKSRGRGREKSREHSHDKPRDRYHRCKKKLTGWLTGQVPVVRAYLSCCESGCCLFILEIVVNCKVFFFGTKDRWWSF